MNVKGPIGRPSTRIGKHDEFAERLQNLMSRHGMTRRDMVRALGCTDAVFGNYYNGWRLPPGKYADKIADVLGITVGYLLYGKKDETPKIIGVSRNILDADERKILENLLNKLLLVR
jgi:transcriptional regulator with XRE-family HTH domain